MDWLRGWLTGGGHVVDSGANIGQMTLYLSSIPHVTVHAFEPTTVAAEWLAQCLTANSLSNVRLVRRGLSSEAVQMAIQLDEARSTLRQDWYREANLEQEVVELMRLDDYLTKQRVDRLRLWKLDVEGHELSALQGAANALERRTIDAILIEVSESTYDDVTRFLARNGYGLNVISPDGTLKPFAGQVTHSTNLVATPGL